NCLVYPSRAEGFGLPIAEAMALKIPTIVTAYGGHMDFCSEETSFLVPYRLVPSGSHFNIPGAEWADPDVDELRSRMRFVYRNSSSQEVRRKVEAAHTNIRQNFRWPVAARRMEELLNLTAKSKQRLAMVTSWDSRCGIAEYSRYLIHALLQGHHSFDVEVLNSPGEGAWPDESVPSTVCWQQLPSTELGNLRQVFDGGFDIVHFQFNFGFFDLDELAFSLLTFKEAGAKVV